MCLSVEIIVLALDLSCHIEVVGLYILLEDCGGCVAGDFHDVIYIHSGEIHESGSGATGGMCADELVFLEVHFLCYSSVGTYNLYR